MNPPVVTVCLPVYNCAPYIRQSVASVLAQDFADWTLTVADNASTDGTWEILNSFHDPRIHLHRHPTNLGPVPNWNYLLDHARTELVCLLGADDFYYPQHLRRKIDLLRQHPEAPFAHGGADFVDAGGQVFQPAELLESPRIEPAAELLRQLLRSNSVNITSTLFRLQALRAHNLRFDARLEFFIDWLLAVELLLQFPYAVRDSQSTAAYRVHGASAAQQNLHRARWALESREMFLASFAEHPDAWCRRGIDLVAESKQMTEGLWRLALQQWRRGQGAEARQAWRLFRRFHGPAVVARGLGGWLAGGLRRKQPRHEAS
jgi:glycosyltransferase involved in cell wall biosynthesis